MTDLVIVSTAFEKLNSILRLEKQEGLRLVVCVEEEFRKFFYQMLAIREVLEDAESRQIKDPAVGYWLHKLKFTCYDIEEMFDEWTTAIQKLRQQRYSTLMRKVCSSIRPYLMCNRRVRLHGEIALNIKYVNKTLHDVGVEKDKFNFNMVKGTGELKQKLTASFVGNMSKIHGREENKDTIVNFLVSESSEILLPIISVVGPSGIGKTALARKVFNDEKVINHFNKRIWVCAYPFNENRIATIILESLSKDDASSNFVELDIVLRHIRKYNKKEKFLLVLDDVHFDSDANNYWEQLNHAFKCNSERSRILVTSSDENDPLKPTKLISLKTLSDNDSWSLCHQIALSEMPNDEKRKKLEEIGQKIIKKYHGLPLGVKILGSLLRFKTSVEEWESVLNSKIWELEEVKRGSVFPLLLLSYYDLPFILRKCLLYCGIFPKNYVIEKDKLIKLWMSQSYLIKLEEERDHMELLGEEYFDHLAMRSFFQDFQINEYDGSIISCKLHDSVSEFARYLAENECFHMEARRYESSHVNAAVQHPNIYVRHLMITLEGDRSSFPAEVFAKDHKERLRSLLVEPRGGFMSNVELSELFDQLTCLRALDLSNQDNSFYKLIKEVPGEIKNFLHLRYLNFSNNRRIRELPESICELCNLQTLEVSRCTNLKNLPQRMEKLINLRHIVNDETSLSYLPKGIEELTRLRTLSEFTVCRNGSNGSKACTLQSLEGLKHLRGCLSIKKLGNHEEKDGNEVKNKPSRNGKAIMPLQNKESLLDLCLCFRKDEETGMGGNEDRDEKFLENLQLPPNLMRLKIVQYSGKVLSSKWVMLLKKLRFLSLNHCMKLDNLPPLGKLSSLESLVIRSSRNVERVGNEFLGLEITDSTEAFPKLEHLEFQDMKEWKEMNYTFAEVKNVKIMERIKSLTIAFCPKLESTLPDYICKATTLKELKIISCPKLEKMKNSIETRLKESGSCQKIDFIDLKYIEKGSH